MKKATWTEGETQDTAAVEWWRTKRLEIGNTRPGTRVFTHFGGLKFELVPECKYKLPPAFVDQLLKSRLIEPAVGDEEDGGSGKQRLFRHEGVDDEE